MPLEIRADAGGPSGMMAEELRCFCRVVRGLQPVPVGASFAAGYITPTGMPPRGFDRMEVFGNGWSARISPNPRPIEVWDEQAHWPMPLEIRADAGGPSGMMAEELRCFCRVVRGLQPVPIGATFTDALQVQRWMERLVAANFASVI